MAFHAQGTFFLAKNTFMQAIQLQPGSYLSKTNKQKNTNCQFTNEFPLSSALED